MHMYMHFSTLRLFYLKQNSAVLDGMQCSAAYKLDLHCLPNTHLGAPRIQKVTYEISTL